MKFQVYCDQPNDTVATATVATNMVDSSNIQKYQNMSRRELQQLAKLRGIKANQKSSEIIRELTSKGSKSKKKSSKPLHDIENIDPKLLDAQRNKNGGAKKKPKRSSSRRSKKPKLQAVENDKAEDSSSCARKRAAQALAIAKTKRMVALTAKEASEEAKLRLSEIEQRKAAVQQMQSLILKWNLRNFITKVNSKPAVVAACTQTMESVNHSQIDMLTTESQTMDSMFAERCVTETFSVQVQADLGDSFSVAEHVQSILDSAVETVATQIVAEQQRKEQEAQAEIIKRTRQQLEKVRQGLAKQAMLKQRLAGLRAGKRNRTESFDLMSQPKKSLPIETMRTKVVLSGCKSDVKLFSFEKENISPGTVVPVRRSSIYFSGDKRRRSRPLSVRKSTGNSTLPNAAMVPYQQTPMKIVR